jgi:hypothetical protein
VRFVTGQSATSSLDDESAPPPPHFPAKDWKELWAQLTAEEGDQFEQHFPIMGSIMYIVVDWRFVFANVSLAVICAVAEFQRGRLLKQASPASGTH